MDQQDNVDYTPPKAIEAPLNDAMERIMSQPHVLGVLVSDKEGLCVGAQGSIHAINSARLTNIFESALKMAPEYEYIDENGATYAIPEQPIVTIETASGGQLVTNYVDGFCTTIAYNASS